jgi:hypothetical protein
MEIWEVPALSRGLLIEIAGKGGTQDVSWRNFLPLQELVDLGLATQGPEFTPYPDPGAKPWRTATLTELGWDAITTDPETHVSFKARRPGGI